MSLKTSTIRRSTIIERQIIESTVFSIPLSELGSVAKDHEIWEETENGAHFKVTRHTIPGYEQFTIIAMTVSGDKRARWGIANDFFNVLGTPAEHDIDASGAVTMEIYTWLEVEAEAGPDSALDS